MKIQLWSYNYSPEPTGIAPVSTAWAEAMARRGHEISVVAAHPHYPEPRWGTRILPYRERIGGIAVLRVPIWPGRASGFQRLRQEASFTAALTGTLPFVGAADAIVAVSPSFPALLPVMLNAAVRRTPWILWLQDILPDGALASGFDEANPLIRSARVLERRSYRSAARIVAISEQFRANLIAKEVPAEKLSIVYNPATMPLAHAPRTAPPDGAPRILAMGNIGHSQGLAEFVRTFEASPALAELGTRLVITGSGVAAAEVRAAITTDRVELRGVIDAGELQSELARASFGLVSQRSDIEEFNLPSKLMNYFARGLPVLASVGRDSEVARLVESSDAGWVVPQADQAALGEIVAGALRAPETWRRRSECGLSFAQSRLTPDAIAERFEDELRLAVSPNQG